MTETLPANESIGYKLWMNSLNAWQSLLMTGLGLILAWLIWNGLSKGAVWVRGVRDAGSANPRDWATPVSRETNPAGFWLAMGLYAAGLLFVVWTLLAFS